MYKGEKKKGKIKADELKGFHKKTPWTSRERGTVKGALKKNGER